MIRALNALTGLTAVFTTREGGMSQAPFASRNLGFFAGDAEAVVAENWRLTLSELKLTAKTLVLPRLVHGTQCAWVADVNEPNPDENDAHESPDVEGEKQRLMHPRESRSGLLCIAPPACDAVATQSTNLALAVTMADCMGILIADPSTGCLAAVHAGWRGTRDQVLAKTLADLFTQGRANPESTWISLGPALGTQNLGLGDEVLAGMDGRYVHALQKPKPEQAGRARYGLDMRAWNRDQALSMGIRPNHIEDMAQCTYDRPKQFFSYRREGARSGRMAAILAWE